jgi:hypothetical protein
MPGSSTAPGCAGARDCAPVHMAFRRLKSVGAQNHVAFAAQWLAYTLPCRRFASLLAEACARLGADVARYAFIVMDLHHLLLAGLPGALKPLLHPGRAGGTPFDVSAQASLLVLRASFPLPPYPNTIPACTENLIHIELVMKSRHACCDDRADLPGPQSVGCVLRVQEPTWSGKCRAPAATSPSLSTARQTYNCLPLTETNTSSRCHRPSGRGRPRLSLRTMIVPNFNAQRRTVS